MPQEDTLQNPYLFKIIIKALPSVKAHFAEKHAKSKKNGSAELSLQGDNIYKLWSSLKRATMSQEVTV